MSQFVTQDFERAMEAFLEPGPDQISSRLAMSIANSVHATPRRGLSWWKRPQMRLAIPVAAVVTLAAAIGLALALGLGRPAPAPTPTPMATPQPSSDGTLRAIGTLRSDQPYRLAAFSVPLRFTTPPGSSITISADSAYVHGQRLLLAGGAITFHDGADTSSDLCNPGHELLGSFGATPQAVGEWLRSTPGLTVSKTSRLPVDGRTALAWNIELAADCYARHVAPPGAGVWFQAGERHRIYAIPVGSGVIALFTWGSDYKGEGEDVLPAVNRLADQIVESMTFE